MSVQRAEEQGQELATIPNEPTEHKFMIFNETPECNTEGVKLLKKFKLKKGIDHSNITFLNDILVKSDRKIGFFSVFSDESAKAIRSKIRFKLWRLLFPIKKMGNPFPFLWTFLDSQQIVKAILISTHFNSLANVPPTVLSEVLEDNKILKEAAKNGKVVEKLMKGLTEEGGRILEHIRDEIVKEEINLLNSIANAQSVPPGDIQIQPNFKIVFEAPFDINRRKEFKLINSSAHRIAYRIIISNQTRLGVENSYGALDPKESVLVAVTCDVSALRHVNNYNDCVTVEWTNIPNECFKQFRREWFQENGRRRWKDLPIEYIV